MKKFFTFSLSVFIALIFTAMSFGQTVVFEDNFDSYTVGGQLACQNPTDWTTWNLAPCDANEDPYVSDLYAFSGSNSVVNVLDNDLVKTYGDLTSGKYSIAFMIYIPTGKHSRFTTLSGFTGGAYEWAMQLRFDPGAGGSGLLDAGGVNPITFTFAYDTWQSVEVIVDLDNDIGEFWFDGAMIHTWQWTLGVFGGGSALQLAASDFYALEANAELYVDDFVFTDLLVQANTWTTKTDMPTARYGLSTSVVNDTIYAIGGSNGSNKPALTTVEAYDPLTDSWTTKAPMPTERFLLSTSAVSGIIYSIGGAPIDPGFSAPIATPVVEAYDLATNTWTTKAPMPTSRWGLSTSVVNDTIYAIGGSDLSVTPFSTVEAYDPATNTWTTKAPMPTARWGLSTIVVNGKIYAFGGQSAFMAFKTFEVYDPATDIWSPMPDMPNIRTWMGTSVVNSIIYLIGGQGANELIVDLVEAYDPATNIWTLGTNMPTARWALSTSAVNERIYVFGGMILGSVPSSKVEEYTPPDPVGVEDPLSVPAEFLLHQNYPNPFNPTTTIKYQIPALSFVTLKVYDVLGSEIITLVSEEKLIGSYEVNFNAAELSSGVYFYQLRAGSFVETKKMVLLR